MAASYGNTQRVANGVIFKIVGLVRIAIAIVLPFVLWALLHSLLADVRVKAWARGVIPGVDRWYRLAFNAVALLTLLPVLALPAVLPDRLLYAAAAPLRLVLYGVQGLCVAAAALTVRMTGAARLFGLAQLAATLGPQPLLVVSGPYRYVRHPLYAFGFILLWASPSMTRNTAILYALLSLYFYVGSLHEETLLEKEHGEAYRRYRAQVPRLVPWFGRAYRPSRSPATPGD